MAGESLLSPAAGLAQATTLFQPSYSDIRVSAVPDTTTGFGDLALGSDGAATGVSGNGGYSPAVSTMAKDAAA